MEVPIIRVLTPTTSILMLKFTSATAKSPFGIFISFKIFANPRPWMNPNESKTPEVTDFFSENVFECYIHNTEGNYCLNKS